MSQLSQINMRYSTLEDRILLLVKTDDLAEFRFWLTRHYVLRMWPELMSALQSDEIVRTQTSETAKHDVVGFQHRSAISESDFSTKYSANVKATPLGESPILLSRFKLKPTNNANQILCLHPHTGNGIDINLDTAMLHSLCHLLSDTVSKTNWGLRMNMPSLSAIPTSQTVN